MQRETPPPRPACPAERNCAPEVPSRRARRGSGAEADAALRPQLSSVRRALRNRPARLGRYRDSPNAGSLASYLRDKRPLHLLPFVLIPIPDRPRARRPEGRTASVEALARTESGETGRRPQLRESAAPHAVLRPHGDGQRSPAPRTRSARPAPAPASAALSRVRDREELSPRPPGLNRPPQPRHAVAAASPGCRPSGPQGSGRPGPGLAQSGGGAGTGREPGAPSGPSPSTGYGARQPPVPETPRRQAPEPTWSRQRYLPRPATDGNREEKAGRRRSPKLTRRPSWARSSAAGGGGVGGEQPAAGGGARGEQRGGAGAAAAGKSRADGAAAERAVGGSARRGEAGPPPRGQPLRAACGAV
ncbi:uncharacterized protein VSU04_015157 [Chlamydotis macqueenii]